MEDPYAVLRLVNRELLNPQLQAKIVEQKVELDRLRRVIDECCTHYHLVVCDRCRLIRHPVSTYSPFAFSICENCYEIVRLDSGIESID